MATLNLVTNVLVKGEQNLKGLNKTLGKVDAKASTTNKGLGGLTSSLTGFINPATAAVAVTTGLGVAAIGAAQAAIDEERGIAALTAALKANDPAAVAHIDQIEETIRARENLAFSDDEQRESLAQLVAQTGSANKALALNRTAMDLARLRNIDLTTASTLLGKVAGGNIGILSRYGIQIRKGATASEALAEIQKRAAGQAEEFADTAAGAAESLGHAFNDLVEDLGKLLLPTLRQVTLFLRDDFIPALRDIGPVLGNVLDVLTFLPRKASDFFNTVTNPFGRLLETQARELEQHQKKEAARLKAGEDAWLGYQNTITNATDGVVDTVRNLTASELAVIEDHWDDIREAGRQTVVSYNAGIFDAQDSLKAEIDGLLKALDEHLAPAEEIAYLRGQKVQLLLARGIAADQGDDGAVAKINQVIADINAQLNALSGYDAGAAFSRSFARGLVDPVVIDLIKGNARKAALAARGIFPGSEPKDPNSPFRGITDAFGFMDIFAAGLTKHDDVVPTALRNALTVPSLAVTPRIGAPAIGGGGATGGSVAVGGPTVNINVQGDLKADERTLPGIMVRGLYASGLSQ